MRLNLESLLLQETCDSDLSELIEGMRAIQDDTNQLKAERESYNLESTNGRRPGHRKQLNPTQ